MSRFFQLFLGHQTFTTHFQMFSWYHLLWLGIAVVAVIFSINSKRSQTTERYLMYMVITSQLLTMIWYLGGSSFLSDGLPLYTCRIAAIAFAIGYFKNSDYLKSFGTFLGFSGGIIALLHPVFFPMKIWHFCNINFFVFHVALLSLSSYYLSHKGDEMLEQKRRVQVSLTGLMLVITVINYIIGSNYSYALEAPLLKNILDEFPWLLYFLLLNLAYQATILIESKVVDSKMMNRAAAIEWKDWLKTKI